MFYNKRKFILIISSLWFFNYVLKINCAVILPKVPDRVYPPVPDIVLNDKLQVTTTTSKYPNGDSNLDDLIDIGDLLNENDIDPEVRPDLFQGDMAMDNSMYKYWRVGLRWDVFPEKKWPNGTVPYAISPLYEPEDQITIYQAIRTINFMTCINFIPWNGKDKDFLLIWPIKFPKGCWSYVGKTGGTQILSLQPPDKNGPNCLGNEGRAIHELMHALGIFHEQSRADRDRFVKIHWDNIVPAYKSNFEKQSIKNTTYSFEYDYDSIMHYGKFFFSKKKGKPTITTKYPDINLGQRRGMSKTDCLKINDLYKCLENPRLNHKYYTLCRVLGL